MLKRQTFFVTLLVMGLVFVLFQVKDRVFDVKQELKKVEQDISTLQESLHIMHAEWAYLNEPKRLKDLGRRYLDLALPNPLQLVSEAKFDKIGHRLASSGVKRKGRP